MSFKLWNFALKMATDGKKKRPAVSKITQAAVPFLQFAPPSAHEMCVRVCAYDAFASLVHHKKEETCVPSFTCSTPCV